jgi:UDPglucose--hexose-1-phosphate uridylyltransferase
MERSEIRKDYFQNKYVIIAPKRARRPHKVLKKEEDQISACYFCPDKIERELVASSLPNSIKNWQVLSVMNKFPALTQNNHHAFGRQEVIIETPDHDKELHELGIEQIQLVVEMYIERFEELRKIKGVKYVIVFKNEGGKAGASISHSHSQVIALPIIPPQIKEEYQAYSKYMVEEGHCPYCDIIIKEKGKNRVVWEDDNLFVVAPFASEFPYGAWFIPKRHFRTMADMNFSEKRSLAHALKATLAKLDKIDVAYNYFLHNSVNGEDYHMHLKLEPRPNVWAGLELGTGIIINPVPPEDAAHFYRK